jgi:hypothetical protein
MGENVVKQHDFRGHIRQFAFLRVVGAPRRIEQQTKDKAGHRTDQGH